MAENTPGSPGHDPLGDRLRATFAAERDDIERRHTGDIPTSRNRLNLWAPLAVAAAVIALAGFFFLGNQPADQAVDLDVAAQPGDGSSDESRSEEGEPGDVEPDYADSDDAVGDVLGPIPYRTGVNLCGELFDASANVAWANWRDVPVVDEPSEGQDPPITGFLAGGTRVEFTGGCATGSTQDVASTWYEIAGDPSGWVHMGFFSTEQEYNELVLQAEAEEALGLEEPPGPPPDVTPPPVPVPDTTGCGQAIEPGTLYFVSGIAVDDPDGGLVAHTQAGIDEPVTRILLLDEVVTATGGCTVLPSGSIWLQMITAQGQVDWASGRYLSPAKSACLVGEQVGTRIQTDRNRTHEVREGDRISSIAAQYDVRVEWLLSNNPGIDGEIFIGDVLRIPLPSDALTLFGPLEGAAWFDYGHVAFAQDDADFYRWYPLDAVRITPSCYGDGPTGPVCLVGDVLLSDPQSPEPVFRDSGSVEGERTGRVIPAFGRGAIHDLVEVRVDVGDNESRTGLVDPTRTGFAESPCSTDPETLDTLEARPCAVNDTTPLESSGSIGSSQSDADHVHNIRIQGSADCVRAVIELGTGIWTEADRPAELLPEITSTKTATAATIRFAMCDPSIVGDCAVIGSGQGEPQRVDFAGGSVFIGVGGRHEVYVTMLHDFGQSSVTLINSPARVIIDWRPDASVGDSLSNPIVGQHAIFPGGLASFESGGSIQGLARPFEAQGSFYIFEATGDPAAPLSEPTTAVFRGFYMAAGWTAGWGEFSAELPALPDGDYVIAFGEGPPGDDGVVWVGSGALVTVTDGETVPVSVVDPIRLTEPITVNE